MRRKIRLNIFSQKFYSEFGIKEISQLKKENSKFKNEAAKTRLISAKLESELNEARNLIKQMTMVKIFK